MKETAKKAMECSKTLGVQFADMRFKESVTESFRVENKKVVKADTRVSTGYGVRVYLDGAMGFAASNNPDEVEAVVKKAVQIAESSKLLLETQTELDTKEAAKATYETPVAENPFEIPVAQKIAFLMEIDENLAQNAEVKRTFAELSFRKDVCLFVDTDGSEISQTFVQSAANIGASAYNERDNQTRSYINVQRGGFETISQMDLVGRAKTLSEEAALLLGAEDCPSGVFDIILTPRQMFLQIHESVGHPTELDRILGSEAAFAGRSFVEIDNLFAKPLKYGSEHVTIVADAACPQGLGTFMYDDEGVKGQNIPLIVKGKFVGLQTSRDNAKKINQNSGGAGLSDGWQNLPIVRMTNINMLPGDKTLDELIEGIDYGFLFDENKSWSIDDLRVNFQFACQIAREIEGGKLTGRVFKNPIYSGKTTEFWSSCDGVANKDFWELVGVPNCGKGQPMQVMRVSHGSSPSRFRKVKVGVADVE